MVLTAAGRFSAGNDLYDYDIRDLAIVQAAGQTYLYATTSLVGGITAYQLSSDGSLPQLIDLHAYQNIDSIGLTDTLTVVRQNGQDHIVFGAGALDGFTGYTVSQAGDLDPLSPDIATALRAPTNGQGSFVLAASQDQAFAYSIEPTTGNIIVHAITSGGSAGLSTGQIHRQSDDLHGIQVGTNQFLLATDITHDAVVSYRIDTDTGGLDQIDLAGAPTGLGMAIPTAFEIVEAFGQTWAIVGSAGTSTLSVVHVDDTGQLTPVDHVMDTLATRFGGVTAVATAQVGDRSFVVAGGADDGLSVFSLLPDGRLVLLETLIHTMDAGLENISSLSATVTGDTLQIFATSGTAGGISLFTIDTGTLGATQHLSASTNVYSGTARSDLLIGSDDNFGSLFGGAGDDVLATGATGGQLTGGTGADLFVIHADAVLTRITDFETGFDRIDLSAYPTLRNLDQLDVTTTESGAEITLSGHTIEIRSANDNPLTSEDLFGWGFVTPDRFTVTDAAQNTVTLGTSLSDALNGTSQADSVQGFQGDDRIFGNAGTDSIDGGAGNDLIFGGSGDDRLSGSAGNDEIWGATGDDFIFGGDGDDEIGGGSSGADLLFGGQGHDTLWGGSDTDTLYGGQGNDLIGAGSGEDTLWGDEDNDIMWGGRDTDTVYGGAGDDTVGGGPSGKDILFGGEGNDTFYANSDTDTLYGGDGHDELGAGKGNDTAYGDAGDDTFHLGQGNDIAYGGSGNDTLYGVQGNDTLNGGSGNDVLSGGNGADHFIFTGQSGIDTITDFEIGRDQIVVADVAIGFNDLSFRQDGNDAIVYIVTGTIVISDTTVSDLSESDFTFS